MSYNFRTVSWKLELDGSWMEVGWKLDRGWRGVGEKERIQNNTK